MFDELQLKITSVIDYYRSFKHQHFAALILAIFFIFAISLLTVLLGSYCSNFFGNPGDNFSEFINRQYGWQGFFARNNVLINAVALLNFGMVARRFHSFTKPVTLSFGEIFNAINAKIAGMYFSFLFIIGFISLFTNQNIPYYNAPTLVSLLNFGPLENAMYYWLIDVINLLLTCLSFIFAYQLINYDKFSFVRLLKERKVITIAIAVVILIQLIIGGISSFFSTYIGQIGQMSIQSNSIFHILMLFLKLIPILIFTPGIVIALSDKTILSKPIKSEQETENKSILDNYEAE